MISVQETEISTIEFSDGTLVPKIPRSIRPDFDDIIHIKWMYEEIREFFVVAQIVDYFKKSRFAYSKIALIMPFFPYSRQDRLMDNGQAEDTPNALKTFCGMVDNLGLSVVITVDPHSQAIES